MALDNFQTNPHRELDPLHFKGKWRGSGSVDSSHVQNQTGPLIKAFAKHEKDAKVNKENVQVWKDALKEVGNIPK